MFGFELSPVEMATIDEPAGIVGAAVGAYALVTLPTTPVLVTLNPQIEPTPESIVEEFEYSHPLLDSAAVTAQGGIAHALGNFGFCMLAGPVLLRMLRRIQRRSELSWPETAKAPEKPLPA